MNNSFCIILDRLIQENLHGPTIQNNLNDPWILVDDFNDLDSKDPRWFELFVFFYISEESIHHGHDDLLFFVRALPSSEKNPDNSFAATDSIFVRRKVGHQLPILSDVVCWKRTLFLNLIVQTACVLTVSCCKKKETQEHEKILDLDFKPKTATTNRTNMIAQTRIIKQVYSAPYKSRMDIKDAFTNEISFPLIYYSVNDYELEDLHLKIHENEYLCVELSVIAPKLSSTATKTVHSGATSTKPFVRSPLSNSITVNTHISLDQSKLELHSPIHKLAMISVIDDPSPFPTPHGHDKIVLFKGAVPFTSLLEVFQQKIQPNIMEQAASIYKTATSFLDTNNALSSSSSLLSLKPNEYILMRGPEGKGQCQVAINRKVEEPFKEEKVQTSPDTTLFDKIKYFRVSMKLDKQKESIPTELDCSMTYVNVSWQSIISYSFCQLKTLLIE